MKLLEKNHRQLRLYIVLIIKKINLVPNKLGAFGKKNLLMGYEPLILHCECSQQNLPDSSQVSTYIIECNMLNNSNKNLLWLGTFS